MILGYDLPLWGVICDCRSVEWGMGYSLSNGVKWIVFTQNVSCVNAGRPFDSPPLPANFASHILVNVVLGSCDSRTGERSVIASGGP